MSVYDFKQYVLKTRTRLGELYQKAKLEPEYRRMGICTFVFLAVTLILSLWLGISLALAAIWYVTY
jgi:hypothetical protein